MWCSFYFTYAYVWLLELVSQIVKKIGFKYYVCRQVNEAFVDKTNLQWVINFQFF